MSKASEVAKGKRAEKAYAQQFGCQLTPEAHLQNMDIDAVKWQRVDNPLPDAVSDRAKGYIIRQDGVHLKRIYISIKDECKGSLEWGNIVFEMGSENTITGAKKAGCMNYCKADYVAYKVQLTKNKNVLPEALHQFAGKKLWLNIKRPELLEWLKDGNNRRMTQTRPETEANNRKHGWKFDRSYLAQVKVPHIIECLLNGTLAGFIREYQAPSKK